jgi:hypothetical protein
LAKIHFLCSTRGHKPSHMDCNFWVFMVANMIRLFPDFVLLHATPRNCECYWWLPPSTSSIGYHPIIDLLSWLTSILSLVDHHAPQRITHHFTWDQPLISSSTVGYTSGIPTLGGYNMLQPWGISNI